MLERTEVQFDVMSLAQHSEWLVVPLKFWKAFHNLGFLFW